MMYQEYYEQPEQESCLTGWAPEDTVSETGEQRIRVACGLLTMPKLFFDANRRKMFSYLNQCRRDGRLKAIVGFAFTDKVINRQVCDFTSWDFWRINRESFYTDVYVTLILTTPNGPRIWKGYLELWCTFNESFTCTIEDFGSVEDIPDHSDDIRMSPFMVPYLKGYQMDDLCEDIWEKAIPEALMDPKKRDGEELARHYGLSVLYEPIYDDQGVGSILFFAGGKLLVKEQDQRFMMEEDKRKDDEKNPPKEIYVPANTIVVNTNRNKKEYASFNIFHEVIHYELHYLFFRLQEMASNDVRTIKMKEVVVTKETAITDPIYWMEKQANRGAYGFLLPIAWMRERIAEEYSNVTSYRHAGDLYDIIGRRLCAKNRIANFRMRARMIQMGIIEAKGSLNWLSGGIRVEPFAFDVKSCEKIEETFIIDKYRSGCLYEKNEAFRKIYDTGKFVWADGHIVRNDSRFVLDTSKGLMLTPWANANVDQCCLRFERVYIQSGVGQYVFGRMNFDEEYVAKTLFYLEDSANQAVFNEMEAEQTYANAFPATFSAGLKKLMERAGITVEEMAEKLNMGVRTFQRWMADEDNFYTVDFVMTVSLILELPDWISELLFDRAGIAFSSKNPRHLALQWIRRAMWKDGVEKANEYLRQRNLKPLSF